MRKMRPRRNPRSRNLIVSEVVSAGVILPTALGTVGGLLTVAFNSLPQASSYAALYRRFRIRKCVWTLLPRYTGADLGTSQYNAIVVGSTLAGWSAGRLVYSIDDTPGLQPPTSELDVLSANGSKIAMGMKKIVISHRPKPLVASYSGVLGAAMTFKTNPWLNTDAPGNGNSGTAVAHYGIRHFFTQPVYATSPQPWAQYDIFCKVTVELADPV